MPASRRSAAPASRSPATPRSRSPRSEEHTSELQSLRHLVCRLLLEKKKKNINTYIAIKKTNKTTNYKQDTQLKERIEDNNNEMTQAHVEHERNTDGTTSDNDNT